MVTILITGPECSGKTTLAHSLTQRLDGLMVIEAAREYLEEKGTYKEADLLKIAKLQKDSEVKARSTDPDFLLVDTGMLVLSIWSKEKYARVDPWIESQLSGTEYDVVLLCRPDLPWEYDPQRENPTDRERLLDMYIEKLGSLERSYKIIEGTGSERLEMAIDYLKQKGHIT